MVEEAGVVEGGHVPAAPGRHDFPVRIHRGGRDACGLQHELVAGLLVAVLGRRLDHEAKRGVAGVVVVVGLGRERLRERLGDHRLQIGLREVERAEFGSELRRVVAHAAAVGQQLGDGDVLGRLVGDRRGLEKLLQHHADRVGIGELALLHEPRDADARDGLREARQRRCDFGIARADARLAHHVGLAHHREARVLHAPARGPGLVGGHHTVALRVGGLRGRANDGRAESGGDEKSSDHLLRPARRPAPAWRTAEG